MTEPLNLGDSAIAGATAAGGEVITSAADVNGQTQGYVEIPASTRSALVQVNFNYGSGGTSLKVPIEVTLDQGTTWIEVYRAAFTIVSGERVVNLSSATPITSPYTPAALSDDAVRDGILGVRWRAKKIIVGTYAGNSSLSVRLVPRG